MRPRLAVPGWYQDLCSCLQVDAACVLAYFGHAPLPVLGAGWAFHFRPGEWEPCEFFYPTEDGSLGRALAPYHPLLCRWHEPSDAEAAEAELIDALRAGLPPIVAVDNYHLPFRPAYHDVHAAHLLVVRGFDPDAETFDVLDPMPPGFDGPLPRAVLRAARASDNADDGGDPFFAGSGVRSRWLELRPDGPFPPLTREWVERVLDANRHALLEGAPAGDGLLRGLVGFEGYVEALPRRIDAEGGRALREIYVLGWALQASASLHADFLAESADRLDWPALREAGRWVDLVAHQWTAFRMAAAHGVGRPAGVREEVARLGREVLRRWNAALAHIDDACGRLPAT
jgi:hypothetical protein